MSSIAPIADSGAETTSYIYRALQVLEILAGRDATPDEVAKALDVHKRTAQRLLDTMVAAGFVQPLVNDTRRYDLTAKILTIAGVLRDRLDLVSIGLPYVRKLRDTTTEFAHLGVPVGHQMVSLVHALSSRILKAGPISGQPGPLHASAIGKALLAFLPEHLDAVCQGGLERYTARTLVTRETLVAHLAQVRAQGYALDDEEIEPGLRCVAAPVRDDTGRVIAALGISGPTIRIHATTIPDLASQVMDIAEEFSQALGYAPSSTRPPLRLFS